LENFRDVFMRVSLLAAITALTSLRKNTTYMYNKSQNYIHFFHKLFDLIMLSWTCMVSCTLQFPSLKLTILIDTPTRHFTEFFSILLYKTL
jgi:hypothetical protein